MIVEETHNSTCAHGFSHNNNNSNISSNIVTNIDLSQEPQEPNASLLNINNDNNNENINIEVEGEESKYDGNSFFFIFSIN